MSRSVRQHGRVSGRTLVPQGGPHGPSPARRDRPGGLALVFVARPTRDCAGQQGEGPPRVGISPKPHLSRGLPSAEEGWSSGGKDPRWSHGGVEKERTKERRTGGEEDLKVLSCLFLSMMPPWMTLTIPRDSSSTFSNFYPRPQNWTSTSPLPSEQSLAACQRPDTSRCSPPPF